jgi:hypothetical protein
MTNNFFRIISELLDNQSFVFTVSKKGKKITVLIQSTATVGDKDDKKQLFPAFKAEGTGEELDRVFNDLVLGKLTQITATVIKSDDLDTFLKKINKLKGNTAQSLLIIEDDKGDEKKTPVKVVETDVKETTDDKSKPEPKAEPEVSEELESNIDEQQIEDVAEDEIKEEESKSEPEPESEPVTEEKPLITEKPAKRDPNDW